MARALNLVVAGLWQCFGCRELFDDKSQLDGYHCLECLKKWDLKEREMSDKKAIANTCRSVAAALAMAKRDKEPAALPEVINSLIKGVGGADRLGEMLREDFDRLRGVGLTEEEAVKHEFKEGTIQRYWQMLLRGLSTRDERVAAVDLQGFTDEELKAVLIPLAAEMLVEDAEFRANVLRDAVNRDPKIIDEILRERSQVVDAGVTKPAEPEQDRTATKRGSDGDMDVDPAELDDRIPD